VLLLNRNPRAPLETFRYSILYLGLLFLALLIDHYLLVPAGPGAVVTGPALEMAPL
jgi:protoheme IX farnesyltransferase